MGDADSPRGRSHACALVSHWIVHLSMLSGPVSGGAVPETLRVLIVESGSTRGALAACRALAAAGWTVGIGSPDRYGLAASSRYCDRWHRVPRVEDGLDAFLEATEAAVVAQRYEAIFCSEDAQTLGLSFGRERLSATVPYPPHERVIRAFDKLELARAAERVGMATPRTTDADDDAVDRAELPVLVKPRLHWTPGSTGAPARIEASICSDRDAVRRRVATIRGHGGGAVLQEIVRGRLVHYLVIVGSRTRSWAAFKPSLSPCSTRGPTSVSVSAPCRSRRTGPCKGRRAP